MLRYKTSVPRKQPLVKGCCLGTLCFSINGLSLYHSLEHHFNGLFVFAVNQFQQVNALSQVAVGNNRRPVEHFKHRSVYGVEDGPHRIVEMDGTVLNTSRRNIAFNLSGIGNIGNDSPVGSLALVVRIAKVALIVYILAFNYHVDIEGVALCCKTNRTEGALEPSV